MSVKKIIFLVFSFFISQLGLSQEPVSWQTSFEKLDANEYLLSFNALIDKNWHLYGIDMPENGPLPTIFNYDLEKNQILQIDKIIESESKTEYDKFFEMDLDFFENNASFKQRIFLKDTLINALRGDIQYQVCDDKTCVFRTKSFVFNLNGLNEINNKIDVFSSKDLKLSDELKINLKNKHLLEKSNKIINSNSSLNLFLLGLLGGLIALLTPCIFPMIPLTVSYFIKSEEKNTRGIFNSFIYGFFIIIIYFSLSLPFHFIDSISPEILNNISTNVILNLIFFIVFLVFAFSFFGYFDLTLPTSWGNRADQSSSKNSLLGIFFMALTLAIVSFSCTGPILGSLLAGSLTSLEGPRQLSIAMTGFGFALALPFTILALFPRILNKLPKSGIWMKNIKVILGFFELALALKFLSNADMVSHWGILPREVFLALWILLSLILSFYLLGLFKFPHEPKYKPEIKQKIIGYLFLSISVFMTYGLNADAKNFKIFSGFLPPDFYSIKSKENDCPLNLECYKDYSEGLQAAKTINKPILLDFTGWACVNCRKIEENVWSKPEIYEILSNDVVIVSLYVDDRKKMSENEQFNFKFNDGTLKKIKTIGDKWSTFQSYNFSSASQPFYVLLSNNEEILNPPIQYTNAENYFNWLKNGLKL